MHADEEPQEKRGSWRRRFDPSTSMNKSRLMDTKLYSKPSGPNHFGPVDFFGNGFPKGMAMKGIQSGIILLKIKLHNRFFKNGTAVKVGMIVFNETKDLQKFIIEQKISDSRNCPFVVYYDGNKYESESTRNLLTKLKNI